MSNYPVVGRGFPNMGFIRKSLFRIIFPVTYSEHPNMVELARSVDTTQIGDIDLIRMFQENEGLYIDGKFGPKSQLKLNLCLAELKPNPNTDEPRLGDDKELTYAINQSTVNPLILSTRAERNRANLRKKFGEPTKVKSTLIHVLPTYPMVLAWNHRKGVSSIRVHTLSAPALNQVFKDITAEFNIHEIKRLGLDQYGGAHNYRNVRGGKTLSTHAWGIAIDINSVGNPMGADPDDTIYARHPELALRFFRIMYRNGFRTLKNDLMHWMYVG